MSSEKEEERPRSSVLRRFFLMLSIGLVCLLFSIQALFRSMLCLCPSQILTMAGLLFLGAGLIIYSIYMLVEDARLRKINLEIEKES
ncbi:MAG: hypothetical protein GX556_10205 [Fibrobacter sp.]|nr:hypothetical protein [Fibrobacter sp.]